MNVREALRLLNPPDTPASDSEASSTASSASAEPRRSALDDYDYDDDFIDDGDLLHDEEVPPTPTSSQDASDAQLSDMEPNPDFEDDDDDDNPNGNDDEDDANVQNRSKSKPTSPHQNRNVVSHGFTTFYVSRGPLPTKSAVDGVISVPLPASRLGNVVIDFPPHARTRFEQQLANTSAPSEDRPPSPSPPPDAPPPHAQFPPNPNPVLPSTGAGASASAPENEKAPTEPTTAPPHSATVNATAIATVTTTAAAITTTSKPAPNLAAPSGTVPLPLSPSGGNSKLSNGPNVLVGTSATASVSKGGGKRQKTSSFPPAVTTEIAKLQALCNERFGDKKPKLDDLPLQQQLNNFFLAAINVGSAKLHSEIKKDKRLVALDDNVWSVLSPFLRTKRASLEAMGHALIWSDREKLKASAANAAERTIASYVNDRRNPASTGVVALECTGPMEDLVFDWYTARTELLEAKNQLASRYKTVKKSLPGWALSLKRQALMECSITETDIIAMVRRVEDRRAAQRRENIERKRKRDSTSMPSTPNDVSSRASPSNADQDIDVPAKRAAVESPSLTGGKPVPVKKAFVRLASAKKVVKRAPSVQSTPNTKGTKPTSKDVPVPQAPKPPSQSAPSKAVSKASAAKPVTAKPGPSPSMSTAQKSPNTSLSSMKAGPPKSSAKVTGKTSLKAQQKNAQKAGSKTGSKVSTKTPPGLKAGGKSASKTSSTSSIGVKPVSTGTAGNEEVSKSASKVAKKKITPVPLAATSGSSALRPLSVLPIGKAVASVCDSIASWRGSTNVSSGNRSNKTNPTQAREISVGTVTEGDAILQASRGSAVSGQQKGAETPPTVLQKSASRSANSVPTPRSSFNAAHSVGVDQSPRASLPAAMPPSSTG